MNFPVCLSMFSILVCTEIVHQNSLHLDFLSFCWEREDLTLLLLQDIREGYHKCDVFGEAGL